MTYRAKRLHAAWFVGAENRFSAPRTHKIEVKTATFLLCGRPHNTAPTCFALCI